jgi:ferredoxin-NADP reductase
LISFEIDEVVELPAAIPLRWDADADLVRSLRLIERIPESDDVTSFVFTTRDGGPLPFFEAGQHLPVELNVPGFKEPIRRTYSLSSGPDADRYRISVKRHPQGIASRFLHDHIEPGTILDARRPAGEFLMPCGDSPIVLISAGVGLTPLVSMLHALAEEDRVRSVWFIHGARDGRHHPLADEVRRLAGRRSGIRVHTAYSQPRREDRIGVDYDTEGRIDSALLATLITDVDAHCLVCGPVRFMADVQSALEDCGVPADHIHTESFGPAAA